MQNTENDLLKESMLFIENNFNVLSNEVPEYLISFWIISDLNPKNPEMIDKGSIFMRLLLENKTDEKNNEFELTPSEFWFLFEKWQSALIFILASIKSGCPLKPFHLFNFEVISNLSVDFLDN